MSTDPKDEVSMAKSSKGKGKQKSKSKQKTSKKLPISTSSSQSSGIGQLSQGMIESSNPVLSSDPFFRASLKIPKNVISKFKEYEILLAASPDTKISDIALLPERSWLNELVDIYQAYSTIRVRVERGWKEYSHSQNFSDSLNFALRVTITRIAKSYTALELIRECIAFLSQLEIDLEKIIKKSMFLEAIKETIYCEQVNAYILIENYIDAIKRTNKISEKEIKTCLRANHITGMVEFLLSLVSHELLEDVDFNETMERQLTAEISTIEHKEKEKIQIVHEIESLNGRPIFEIIERYASYAVDMSKQDEEWGLFFIARSMLFFVAALSKREFSIVEAMFRRAIKAFPDTAKLEISLGRLFFQKAIIYKIFENYIRKYSNLEENSELAIQWIEFSRKGWEDNIRLSAQEGYTRAQTIVSIFFEEDKKTARKLQQQAATNGEITACYHEAHDLIHEDDGLNDEEKKKTIFALLNKAIAGGNVTALCKMGDIYLGGFRSCLVEIDYDKAIEYYQRAAEYNAPSAWRGLGRALLVRRQGDDAAQGILFLQQAKEHNDIEAMLLFAHSFLWRSISVIKEVEVLTLEMKAHRQRMAIVYVVQGIMQCQDVLSQLDKMKQFKLDENAQGIYQKYILEIGGLLCYFFSSIRNDIFLDEENKIVTIFFEKISAIFLRMPYNEIFKERLKKISDGESDVDLNEGILNEAVKLNPFLNFLALFFLQLTDSYKIKEDLNVADQSFLLEDDFQLKILLDIYRDLKGLDNVALILYEISNIVWSKGTAHHAVFTQYKKIVQRLFEDLLREIEYFYAEPSPYLLSCLCQVLLSLGRLRLYPQGLLTSLVTSAIIKRIMAHIDTLSVEDYISVISSLSFMTNELVLRNTLLNKLIVKLQIHADKLSFIQISHIYYALAVIDANAPIEASADLIRHLNNIVIPYLSRPQPFVYLHQWILAVDYFLMSRREWMKGLTNLSEFKYKYDHIYRSRQGGKPSHFQNRVQGYAEDIFGEALQAEVFFGLLPGDIFVQRAHLLIEVNGPTHFNSNSFESDEAELSSTARDIFHQRYIELQYLLDKDHNLHIIGVPFTLSRDLSEERKRVVAHIRAQREPAQVQPHSAISGSLAQTFLPPPPSSDGDAKMPPSAVIRLNLG